MFLVIEKAGDGDALHVEVHTRSPRRVVAVLTCLASAEGRAALDYLRRLDVVSGEVGGGQAGAGLGVGAVGGE